MSRQLTLGLLLLLAVGAFPATLSSTPHPLDTVEHNEIVDNHVITDETPKVVKISTPKVKEVPLPDTTSSTQKSPAANSTAKPVSDEILNALVEPTKHNAILADDPRFNKMLPDKHKVENNKSDENYDDDYYDYEEYNYDDDDNDNIVESGKDAKSGTEKSKKNKKIEMKPIKEDDKRTSNSKLDKSLKDYKNEIRKSYDDNQTNNIVGDIDSNKGSSDDDDDDDEEYNDDDDDEGNDEADEDDDDDADDDDAGGEEIIFNENVPCPRYCVCARNINSYLVATCSRIDPETQKFGSDITDLIVTDVGPKYPIYIGSQFFAKMGLKMVSSIKIANCTLQYLHAEAFHGLDELYSVNLTNVGLSFIDPNTFTKNKKLRMVTISGNDLSGMAYQSYLLKSSSIEELDLSRNGLRVLSPTAFAQLSSIVYINLSQNHLEKLPEKLFDSVETIEELDLSYNDLKFLPPTIFNRTALAILQLKYNSLTGDLSFGTSDLQQLDLSFNSIQQIHHGMFDKMTGLTNLNLKGNGIKKIQTESFLTLKNLRHIDLSINELDQISRMVFYKNSELDVIRLNDNPRLSQLPTDGFLSSNGYFTVYYLDVSNCAIGALGHKTFSSMPHLATLKLAWNNINNLERDTFSGLTKLTELDLSNNLIKRLDELIFMENNELTKLNLAGNPIHKLSIRLFLPFNKLRELDVSDCELNALFSDNHFGIGRKYKFYDTLRTFNASLNQIKKISSADIKSFKNLRTLDITHNPLKCNEDFQDFISYVSLNTKMVPQSVPNLANLESDATLLEYQPAASWAKLAHEVCNHHEMLQKPKGSKLEEQIKEYEKDLDIDSKKLFSVMHNNKVSKMHKILDDSRNSEVVIDDHLVDDSVDEDTNDDDANDADEDDDNDSDYDDEDEDTEEDDDENEDEFDSFDKDSDKLKLPKAFDHGVKIEEVKLNEDTTDGYLLKKFMLDDDGSDNSEEEIIIERGRIYYSGYRFLIPMIIIVLCIVCILLAIAKIVSTVMRKRGERYRMALLASSKNSIVYQKLSEDIKPPVKECKQPKVHRYAPINQV